MVFIKWISILYNSLRGAVLVNGSLSSHFALFLCLLLSLAIDTLAIVLQNYPMYTGIMIGSREDRMALYADDMLLFMSNL